MTLYTWSPKCASSVQCGHCDPRCDQTGGRVLTLSNQNLPRGTHSVATVGYTGATICPPIRLYFDRSMVCRWVKPGNTPEINLWPIRQWSITQHNS